MKAFRVLAAVLAMGLMASAVYADAQVGQKAPGFTLTDQAGKSHNLSDFAGKVVVLEWFNDGCPYVQKHYKDGHMNALASKYQAEGVVWLAINTTSGTDDASNAKISKEWKIERPMLNDASGAVGKEFGAKTTPHMYVIDKTGTLVYAGAIDSDSSSDTSAIAGATNYVAAALDEVLAGKPVTTSETKPYGCSVKYGN